MGEAMGEGLGGHPAGKAPHGPTVQSTRTQTNQDRLPGLTAGPGFDPVSVTTPRTSRHIPVPPRRPELHGPAHRDYLQAAGRFIAFPMTS